MNPPARFTRAADAPENQEARADEPRGRQRSQCLIRFGETFLWEDCKGVVQGSDSAATRLRIRRCESIAQCRIEASVHGTVPRIAAHVIG